MELKPTKLGFGLMRLPRKGLGTDDAQVREMVDAYLEAGGTYFDTAHIYPGSEPAIRKALVERVDREKYLLATKLNAFIPPLQSAQAAKKQLDTSLERTGAGYFDYYLLHSIMDMNVSKYDRMKLWEYVQEQKEKGRIRHAGFSFHAGPDLLDRLLTEHPETEFVQLQINYLDWESSSVKARQNYEVAKRHGKPVVVMEPVKGGKLANPPEEVKRLFAEVHPDWSPALWALRFAMSLEGVMCVLSGMSTMGQMKDNLSALRSPELGEAERKVIRQAQKIMGSSQAIPCTGCRYCRECPKEINIPGILEAANLRQTEAQVDAAQAQYREAVQAGARASSCISCHKCEGACPQHIKITEWMHQCAEWFDD